MKRIYTLLVVAVMLTSFVNISRAQVTPDSVKIVMLRIKSSKPDLNISGKGTAKADFENDLIAKASIGDFNLTSDELDSAMLRIFFKDTDPIGDYAFFDMEPAWVDTMVTWNSAASLTVADTSFATLTLIDADTTYWLNITDFIKAKLDAEVDFGWRSVSVDGIVSATTRTSYHVTPFFQPTIFLYPKDFTGITRQQGISISIFPNPATDYLRVDLGENTAGTVVLYNTIGASVLRKQFHSANIKLDLTVIESGIYFLSIESEDTNFQTRKVIVH